MEAPTRVTLVLHTHWDREWYEPFSVLSEQLVGMETLLDLIAQGFPHFHLDGQTAMIDDDLDRRPERSRDVAGAVSAGRLSAGPWVTQMDEFLTSGESHIRNLEMGIERARSLGRTLEVGYMRDQFGPHRADAADPAAGGDQAGDGVPWRPERYRHVDVLLALARRERGAGGIAPARLLERLVAAADRRPRVAREGACQGGRAATPVRAGRLHRRDGRLRPRRTGTRRFCRGSRVHGCRRIWTCGSAASRRTCRRSRRAKTCRSGHPVYSPIASVVGSMRASRVTVSPRSRDRPERERSDTRQKEEP